MKYDNNRTEEEKVSASLKTLASEYGDRIEYVSGSAKEQFDLSAALIRPDGIISWASDIEPDCSELQKAVARWFVRNSGTACCIGRSERPAFTSR